MQESRMAKEVVEVGAHWGKKVLERADYKLIRHGPSRTLSVTRLIPKHWEVVRVELIAQEEDRVLLRVTRLA